MTQNSIECEVDGCTNEIPPEDRHMSVTTCDRCLEELDALLGDEDV